jgi:hypothetical protein
MAGERLQEALRSSRKRYRAASRQERSGLLDEVCRLTGYHRNYAIGLLNARLDGWRGSGRKGASWGKTE